MTGASFVSILVYADDLLIVGNDLSRIQDTKLSLTKKFHMKDLGELRYFLGIEVDRTASEIFLSQRKFMIDLLHHYKMQNCKPLHIPMDSHLKLTTDI